MTVVAHATVADLVAFMPAGALAGMDLDRVLARASKVIDSVVRLPYATDDDGLATDADLAAALRDATCAQVEFWTEVGEAHDVDGLAGSTYSVPGYSGKRPPRVAPRAIDELSTAGLLGFASTSSSAAGWWQL